MGVEVGVAQGVAHDAESAFMFGSGLGHVIGVGGHAITNQLGEDGSVAAASVFEFFENEDACAFAHDEAVTIFVPGAAGAGGIVVAGGKGAHGGESANSHGSNGGFGAAGDHDIGIAALDDTEGIADGVGAGGAGGSGGFVRALGAEAHGNVSGGEIDDGGGNEEGGNLARSAFEERRMLALDHVESADAGADVNADALGIFWRDLKPGHLHGFVGGGDGEVDEAAHLLDFFFLDELKRVEVMDLGGDLTGKGGRVESGNAADTALAGE